MALLLSEQGLWLDKKEPRTPGSASRAIGELCVEIGMSTLSPNYGPHSKEFATD